MEEVDVMEYYRRLKRIQQAAERIDWRWIAYHLDERPDVVADVLEGKRQSQPILNGIERILIQLSVYGHVSEDQVPPV